MAPMVTNPILTFTLLFESINRSATNESSFSCEISAISGLKLNWFRSRSTLPAAMQYIQCGVKKTRKIKQPLQISLQSAKLESIDLLPILQSS